MATNFPTSLDSLTNPQPTDPLVNPSHSAQHTNANDAIEALQAKVGVDNSAVTTSIDYKLRNLDGSTITNGTVTGAVVNRLEEKWNIVNAAANGTINIDVLTSGIWYYTLVATNNYTLNFRGNSTTTLSSTLALGDSITVVFINTNGATAYVAAGIQIDGVTQTAKTQNGAGINTVNANALDIIVATIVKTGTPSTYVTLVSQTPFS